MVYSIQLILSLLLDALFGDPRWYPHPVRGIGWIIKRCELFYRHSCTNLRLAGTLTVVTVVCFTSASVFFLLFSASLLSFYLEVVFAIILIYIAFSTKDLLVHSNAVYSALLSQQPLEKGRQEVGKIVGRDTSKLDEKGITRACVETVAENMVDGTTAPLFYAVAASFLSPFLPLTAIGCSAVGIFAYKAINTMDSMIGYKCEKYLYFGRTAARLDDAVNYLPARVSGYCIIIAAWILRLDWKNCFIVYFRDNMNHSSPNAAHPEAAVAGALGVRLGGPSVYFGTIVEKPYIGDKYSPINPKHIKCAHRLVVTAIAVFTVTALFAREIISSVMT